MWFIKFFYISVAMVDVGSWLKFKLLYDQSHVNLYCSLECSLECNHFHTFCNSLNVL